ncbi:MAG TPA: HAMP domain-containing protein, partial [Candidatus Ozemobacteraceae bacterium]|nr:HAMP domain-containing protein [Candidatus Ozemobacteraceae bacterium]
PEYHLGVFVPRSYAQHPARSYLTLLNILLVGVFLLTLFFLRELTRWQEEMPLRIFGQLNLALSLSALLPLVGFLLVAWSYSSFHYAQERRMTMRRVEERMQFIDADIRGYREKQIQAYRAARDTIQDQYLDRLSEVKNLLAPVVKNRQASDYILHLADGRVLSTFNGNNPLIDFARAIPKRILMALPIAQPETGTSGAEMRESLKDEIIMKAIEENVPGLMTSMDKQFLLSVSAKENTTIYLDYVTDPRREQPIVGVLAFFLATDIFMQNFFGKLFFSKPMNQATVGLDRIRVVKIDNDANYVFPVGERLTPREQEIFEFCQNTRKSVVWDDTDTDRPWFYGAQFIANEPFVAVVGFDGQKMVQNRRILNAGIAFGVLYALVIFFLTTRFLTMRFAEPLLKLRAAAESVEQQNYTVRVEIAGRDEFNELAGVFNRMVKGLHERQQMSRFVSGDVMEAVTRGDDATQEATRTTVSVLFSDIRGFTELSEKVDAAEIVRMLNAYFTAMESCIVD